MNMNIIFDEQLFEKTVQEIERRSLTLNESFSTSFSKYPKHIFEPLEDYLRESFTKGLIEEGFLDKVGQAFGSAANKAKGFIDNFESHAKEVATKISSAVKQFSFKKVFATVSRMMLKIKQKVLGQLMVLFEPFRAIILKYKLCDDTNKADIKSIFKLLVTAAKSIAKEEHSEDILDDKMVSSIGSHLDLNGLQAIKEDETKTVAKFDEKDVKYLGFFNKMMLKIGIKDAKINGFFASLTKKVAQGAIGAGVMTIIAALFPTAGVIAGIATAVGAAVAAAPLLVMIIGAILFGIGLFMFVTWLIKPYPTIENCKRFLASIFDIPEDDQIGNNQDELLGKTAIVYRTEVIASPAINMVVAMEATKEGYTKDEIKEFEKDEKDTSDSPKRLKKKLKTLIDDSDAVDYKLLLSDKNIEDHEEIVDIFTRKILSKKGRKLIRRELNDIPDEDKYTRELEDLLNVINEAMALSKLDIDEDGDPRHTMDIDRKELIEAPLFVEKGSDKENKMEIIVNALSDMIDAIEDDIK